MILIYQKRIRKALGVLLLSCALGFLCVHVAHGQGGGLSLSVTPTLFQMSAVAGQSWSSGVKVINNNPHELTVYAQVVNFAPQGESGEGKFIPVFENATEGTTLAEWVTISREPVVISPEQSVTIPFTVQVANDAAPGGHFAAILIGTKPPEASGNVKVTTSQIVTSLFFVRIAGDVTESGVIREFRSTERFINTPKADFEVRFENKGNVHLQPQGEIVITNMWGKQRGVIPINHQTHFGNVLPNSIRKFEFGWSGEPSFADIGRYKATLTLAYGSADKKFESATEYFYVVPVRATLIFFSVVIALVLLVRWSISAYIRRMLMLSGIDPYESSAVARKRFQREGDVRIIRRVSITEPMRQSVQEVQTLIADTQEFPSLRSRYLFILKTYKLFFAGGLAILSLCSVLVFFVFSSQKDQRDFEVVITNPDAEVTLSSEDILYEEAQGEQSQTAPVAEQSFSVVLVNSSDTPGTAAAFAPQLQSLGYTISDLRSDFGAVKARSVIVYAPALAEEALDLSKKIGGVLLSADVATSTDRLGDIILYIGNDLVE